MLTHEVPLGYNSSLFDVFADVPALASSDGQTTTGGTTITPGYLFDPEFCGVLLPAFPTPLELTAEFCAPVPAGAAAAEFCCFILATSDSTAAEPEAVAVPMPLLAVADAPTPVSGLAFVSTAGVAVLTSELSCCAHPTRMKAETAIGTKSFTLEVSQRQRPLP